MEKITLTNLELLLDSLEQIINIHLKLNILQDAQPNGHPGNRFNQFSLQYGDKWVENILTASTEYDHPGGEQRFISEPAHINLLAQIDYRSKLIKEAGKKPTIYDPRGNLIDFDQEPCSLYLGDNFTPLLKISRKEMDKLIHNMKIPCAYTVMYLSNKERRIIEQHQSRTASKINIKPSIKA